MARKLSPRQREAIRLLQEGWEMGFSVSIIRDRVWLQKNGIVNVHRGTFVSLRDAGLIVKVEHSFPTHTYGLTEAGKKLEL